MHPEVLIFREAVDPLQNQMFFVPEYTELFFVRECDRAVWKIDNALLKLHEGDVVLIPGGIPQGFAGGGRLVRDVIRMTLDFLQQLEKLYAYSLSANLKKPWYRSMTGWSRELYGSLFQSGVCETCQPEDKAHKRIVAGSILAVLFFDRSRACLPSRTASRLQKIMNYIESNLNSKLTMEHVAKEFEISKSTLSHIFRKEAGISFYTYVTHRRLEAAKCLIEQDVSLESVGRMVGFTEHSTFYRAFKGEYGSSPKEYRDQIRQICRS